MPLRSTELMLRRCMIKLVRQKKLESITIGEICEMAQIGKWQYQISMQHTPDEFSIEKFENNEW